MFPNNINESDNDINDGINGWIFELLTCKSNIAPHICQYLLQIESEDV
ncbi:6254_t:CDS:1, partial [Racocetra persica]